ncbi:hypothetical protein MRX96_041927 [Rhipicephalus microplus]
MPKRVVVHCSAVEGSEPFQFSWIKDGARLESHPRVEVKQLSETLSTLTIYKAGAEDIGKLHLASSPTRRARTPRPLSFL